MTLGFQHISDNFNNEALQIWCRYHALAKSVNEVYQHAIFSDTDNDDISAQELEVSRCARAVVELFYVHAMPDETEADNISAEYSSFHDEIKEKNAAKFKKLFKKYYKVI